MTYVYRTSLIIFVIFLFLTLSAAPAGAQDPEADQDPDLLQGADTSSPRDTLRGFLTNANQMVADWRPGEGLDPAPYNAFRRALEALDFSATPYSDSWTVRAQRLLLLKEILDRVELPPDEEIPGVREVDDGDITQWSIPGTRLKIVRIEEGLRAGEFLFSADTVEQLETFYKMAKHLPYKSGVPAGKYEAYVDVIGNQRTLPTQVRKRLKPVETSSPRSTLQGFLDSVNLAHELIMEADTGLGATPPTLTKEQAREIEIRAGDLLNRAILTLDLSQTPRALRQNVGIETVLRLKEIFDRTALPPIEVVPSAEDVAAARRGVSRLLPRTGGALRWRYPDTEIEIVEITEGERQGQFLFSGATVRRVNDFYEQIQQLPYRDANLGRVSFEYVSPGTSEGFYDYYVSTPGYLIPGIDLLGSVVDGLPSGLKTRYGGQALWQWVGLAIAILAIVLAAYVIFYFIRLFAKRLSSPLDDWLKILAPAIVALFVLYVNALNYKHLKITGDLLAGTTTVAQTIFFVFIAWTVYLICKAIAETIIASPRIGKQSIDASLARIAARIIGFLLGAWIVVVGAQALGVNMIPLIAGLGVGGLAVALAAQKTIANFIGSMILFANKPVRAGDFCRYGDQVGTVERIGLISTRIRSLERTVVTVPNAEFSEMKLDNFSVRDQRLMKFILGLRYETTPEQMRYILAQLRALLLGHPKVTPDPARVRFIGFGTYSKDLEVFAYLRCQDQSEFLAIQEDILLRMEDIVNKAGSGFAFPSQTTYLGRDTGIDTDSGEKAEAKVKQWRSGGKLPFPEFEQDKRERLADILDYPPKGSPDYEPRTPSTKPASTPHELPPSEQERRDKERGDQVQSGVLADVDEDTITAQATHNGRSER